MNCSVTVEHNNNMHISGYRIYSIYATPLNYATLQYYSKGFIFVSGNNFNCTAPYFCKHLAIVFPYLKYSYQPQSK